MLVADRTFVICTVEPSTNFKLSPEFTAVGEVVDIS
jgi:hypothetical protein